MDQNYQQFVEKLNAYIRKFYLYRLVRGIMLFVLLFIVYFALISILESFNYFLPGVKSGIAIFTVLWLLIVIIYFIIKPLIKLFGVGKVLSYYDVSNRLQHKFPEINDRLINIIELSGQSNLNYSNELVQASIDQKIEELKIFSFSEAINFKDLRVIFIGVSGVTMLFLLSFLFFPDLFRESTVRLIRVQQKFEKPAPFEFILQNTNLEVVSGESIELKVLCKGKELPEIAYVNIGGNNFLMQKDDDSFKYNIENINSSFLIYFTDNKYVSAPYTIKVLNKPFISEFSIVVIPPAYTGLSMEEQQNIGDLKIASGTVVKWMFKTVDTDSLELVLSDSTRIKGIKSGDSFSLEKTFYEPADYTVSIRNARLFNENKLLYKVQLIPDLFPQIEVVQLRDTLDFRVYHFKGNIIDDYGFHQLTFNLKIEQSDSIFSLPFTPSLLDQDFFYSFNFESVKNLGKSFNCYFSVYDNDVIKGYKRTISETFNFRFPDYLELLAKEQTDINEIDRLMEKSAKLAEDIQQEFENFKIKQIDSKLSDYDKFQTVKEIMNKKSELENVLNEIAKKNSETNNFMNSFIENKEDILKKQEQIEELLNEVFSDELKKLFEEFNELAKQFDSKKFDQLSKQMEGGLDDLSKQLDRNMQMLKKLKVEQKVERVLNELQNLAKSEKELLFDLNNKGDINKVGENENVNSTKLENIEKDYNDAVEFNKTLEKPVNLLNFDREFSDIKKNYEKSKEELGKKNRKRAGEEIEKNIKNMDELAFGIDQMLKSGKKKENKINLEDLMQILENLIIVSFEQEKLMNSLATIDYNNPLVNRAKVKQQNIQNQVSLLKDSLYALSKRTPEITAIVNKELLALENNLTASFENMESGNLGGSRMFQQYGFTAANNLALFISEAIDNLKKQEQNEMDGGEGDCDKPGEQGSKPGMKMLKESQNSIKEQLQQMIDAMKKGEMGKMGKAIGQTIAQQEMMQQLIREMLNGSALGKESRNQLQAVDQLLEQSRKDLINRNITNELISRQNLILDKLLSAEKSEIERDFEDKRESKTGVDVPRSKTEGYFEYKNATKNDQELIQRNSYRLNSFYDKKYNSYIKNLQNIK
jgi:hypothetical protein